MLVKFKKAIDRRNQFVVLLTDLSKAFGFIDHKLISTKLYGYGVSSSTLNIISSYLKNRAERIKISDCFSIRSKIESGVPQGSLLGSLKRTQGPLLFNINMINLFYEFVCY